MSQVEVNVKLNGGQGQLQRFLLQNDAQNIRQSGIDPVLSSQYPFLQNLRLSHAAKVNGGNRYEEQEMQKCFTLTLSGNNPAARINQLASSGLFEFVEENRTRKLYEMDQSQLIPSDDSLSRQWYHPFVRSFDAWDITLGSPNVKIGILDTGLDYEHPELTENIAINPQEDINGNGRFDPWPSDEFRNGVSGDFDGIDDDGNGFTDDVIGYDFTDQPRSPFGGDFLFEDSDPLDDNAHGTLTAGVIFAAHNGIGGAGLAPNCQQVVLRAFAANGAGEDDDIARAIVYAADNGVQILNFSFGDVYPSLIMHEAIRYADSKGVFMVGSAGNGTGDELHYPSGYNEVVSVSATTVDLQNSREFLWPLSSYGVTVDLAAPGSQIFTTDLRDTTNGVVSLYRSVSGTSFAAPMVAATAALILSQRGQLSPQQLRGIITSSTDDVSDPGWDHFTGAGRLNMRRALQVIGTSNVRITSPLNDRGSFADSVAIIGTILDPEFSQWHLEYRAGTEDQGEWISILSDQIYQKQDDTLAMWGHSGFGRGGLYPAFATGQNQWLYRRGSHPFCAGYDSARSLYFGCRPGLGQ
ncbi:MAG: S8 family serine peptidase [Bacteroidota bacterium]